MAKNNAKRALLTDDVPNAKIKSIVLVISGAALTLALAALLFAGGKLGWGVAVSAAIIVIWAVAETLEWLTWRSIAYRLTATEEGIELRLFCRKKKIPYEKIKSYGYKKLPNSTYYRFTLTLADKTASFDTQYRDEMMAILQTRTVADTEGVNRGLPID